MVKTFNMLHLPAHLWPADVDKPSKSTWERWKCTITDYMELLPVLQPGATITELHKVKLLRQFLGDGGQRHFDALSLGGSENFSLALKSWMNYGDHAHSSTPLDISSLI